MRGNRFRYMDRGIFVSKMRLLASLAVQGKLGFDRLHNSRERFSRDTAHLILGSGGRSVSLVHAIPFAFNGLARLIVLCHRIVQLICQSFG